MNTEIEKKWFIYVDDHHEGPFSLEEVYLKHKGGLVKSDSYFWKEGMADWQMLSQIEELQLGLKKKKDADDLLAGNLEASPKTSTKTMISDIDRAEPELAPVSSGATNINSTIQSSAQSSAAPSQKKSGALATAKWVAVFAITFFTLTFLSFAGIALVSQYGSESLHSSLRPTFTRITNKLPFLGRFIKLVPNMPDLTPEGRTELEMAMSGKPEDSPGLAFVLSQQDANRPFFYIASNLPAGTKLDVLLIGNGETLLNRLQFFTQTSVVLSQGFTKTEVILGDGGQPLPKGEYNVYVVEAYEQEAGLKEILAQLPPMKLPAQVPGLSQGAKYAVTKTLFLGGERDQAYLTRLKAFHDKVKETATKELTELKQYSDMLSLQFNSITGDFKKLFSAKKIAPAQKLAWNKKIEQWKGMQAQMNSAVQTWSEESLKNDFFYGKLYELVKGTFESLKVIIEIENGYIAKPGNKASFEIQHSKAFSETRDAVDLLNIKLQAAIQAPKTPAGLPTREGI